MLLQHARLVFVMLAGLCAARASAQSALAELRVDGDASCLNEPALRERIAQYSSPNARPSAPLRIALHGAERSAELELLRDDVVVARRHFTNLPEICSDRRDALALSIALAVEHAAEGAPLSAAETAAGSSDGAPAAATPDARMRASESSTALGYADRNAETSQAKASMADPPPPPSAARTPPTAANARLDAPQPLASAGAGENLGVAWSITAGGRWLVQVLPSPVLAASAGLELQLSPSASLELSGLVSAVAETRFAAGDASAQLVGGEGLGCRAVRFASFAVQGCIGATAAAYLARGHGYYQSLESTLLWAAVLGRAALRWPHTGPLALRASLQGLVNVRRPELRVEGASERLTLGIFGGSLGLDMVVALQ